MIRRYRELRIDVVDRLVYLIYNRCGLAPQIRWLLDARKYVVFALVEIWTFLVDFALRTSRTYPQAIRAHVHEGGCDLLLVSDSAVLFSRMAEAAVGVASSSGDPHAVAIVVENRDSEIALRVKTGAAHIINLQSFWLDQKVDIAIHEATYDALSAVRNACVAAGDPHGQPCRMFDAVFQELHARMVWSLRIAAALRQARERGARIFVLAVKGNSALQAHCYGMLARSSARSVAVLRMDRVALGGLFSQTDFSTDYGDLLARARAHLGLYRSRGATSRSNAGSGQGAPRIALITDAQPNSIYWHAVRNLVEASVREQTPLRVMVAHQSVARRLKPFRSSVELAIPSVGKASGKAFAEAFGKLLDVAHAVVARHGASSTDADHALGYAVAELTSERFIDGVGYRAYRALGEMERWLAQNDIRSIIALPHWSRLAWATINAARTLHLPVASAPAVTVVGNRASIVGWEGLSLVGCYGEQCRAAFTDLGYLPDRLVLVGNISLDHTYRLSRERIRRSLPVLRGVSSNRRIVLFATSGINTNEPDILRAIGAVCAEPDIGALLVVRPHPAVGERPYRGVVRKLPDQVALIMQGSDVHEAIVAADVVVTDFSTVGAEAALLGRPVLVVNMTGAPFPANNYADLGVAVQASSLAEIAPRLRRLLLEGRYWANADAAATRFVAGYDWQGDGQAARRFLRAVKGMTD